MIEGIVRSEIEINRIAVSLDLYYRLSGLKERGEGARWSGGHAVASISRVSEGIVAATRRPTLFEFLMMHLSRADLALLSRNFHGPEEREVLDRFAVIALINYRTIDTGTEGAGEINFIVPSPSRRPCPSFVHYSRRSKKSRRSHEVVRSYARTMTDDGSMRARARARSLLP